MHCSSNDCCSLISLQLKYRRKFHIIFLNIVETWLPEWDKRTTNFVWLPRDG